MSTDPVGSPLKSGFCFGGPVNTLRITSNGVLGFLWVDATINTLWIYNWNGNRRAFFVVSDDGQPIMSDPDNGILYGVENESEYQVFLRPSLPQQ